jgi:hypothetical protein
MRDTKETSKGRYITLDKKRIYLKPWTMPKRWKKHSSVIGWWCALSDEAVSI